MLGCSVMAITAGFELVNLGSIPSTPTSLRIATANFKNFTVNETKNAILFYYIAVDFWVRSLGFHPS